jgi:hypothetical protein
MFHRKIWGQAQLSAQQLLKIRALKVVLHDPRFRRTKTADAEAARINRELHSSPPPPSHQLKQRDTGKQYSTRRIKESPSIIVVTHGLGGT